MNKAISEKNFIAVIYEHFSVHKLHKLDKDFRREEEERMARLALSLHKDYWSRCKDGMEERKRKNAQRLIRRGPGIVLRRKIEEKLSET